MEKSVFLQLGIWNWFILAGIFALLELLAPGYFLMWYGAAAVVVGALAIAVDLTWQMQLVLYALFGLGLLALSIRFAGNGTGETDKPLLNKRVQSHVGKTYQLVEPSNNGRGRIKIGDSIWSVQLEDTAELAAGTGILITGVNGTQLIGKAG